VEYQRIEQEAKELIWWTFSDVIRFPFHRCFVTACVRQTVDIGVVSNRQHKQTKRKR